MVAGYEIQTDGFAYTLTNLDSDGGPPTFVQANPSTDWIIPHAEGAGPGTYHVRMTNTGGSDTLAAGSAALGVWIATSASTIWTIENGSGSGFNDWIGTIDISLDGGSTTADSATVTLETNVV